MVEELSFERQDITKCCVVLKVSRSGYYDWLNRPTLTMYGLTTASDLTAHSDRGSQYAAEDYRAKLEAHQITASMSRKGNCYDNAFAETFFKTLKVELVYRTNFKTRAEAKAAIFEFIEVWYNRQKNAFFAWLSNADGV